MSHEFVSYLDALVKQGREEVTLDLDLVADVIEHIDRYGEPGN